jgi:alkylation response protein AidB-like acyl-CoA dehydrogenase
VLRAVLGEEVASRELAEPGLYSMVEVLVPTVLSYASLDLAASVVPLLLSGQEQWCQGFSEPGSGSDLASLSTRA